MQDRNLGELPSASLLLEILFVLKQSPTWPRCESVSLYLVNLMYYVNGNNNNNNNNNYCSRAVTRR